MTIELDPTKVSPQTHRFVGMYRPPLNYVTMGTEHPQFAGVGCCPCGMLEYRRSKGGCDAEYDYAVVRPVGVRSVTEEQLYGDGARMKIREHWLAGHYDVPQWEELPIEGEGLHQAAIKTLGMSQYATKLQVLERIANLTTPSQWRDKYTEILQRLNPPSQVDRTQHSEVMDWLNAKRQVVILDATVTEALKRKRAGTANDADFGVITQWAADNLP